MILCDDLIIMVLLIIKNEIFGLYFWDVTLFLRNNNSQYVDKYYFHKIMFFQLNTSVDYIY